MFNANQATSTQPQAEQPTTHNESLSIDEVLQELEHWCIHRSSPAESIPDSIWMKIFKLTEVYSETAIRPLLRLSGDQFKRKRALLVGEPATSAFDSRPQAATPSIQLCQAKVVKQSYQPEPLPQSQDNVIVELKHADGRLMKIHTTSSSCCDLMRDFFSQK